MACPKYEAKSEKLGMGASVAYSKLLKDIIFDLISQTGDNFCYRCGLHMTRADFSIEHKEAWLNSSDPHGLFFDLENISFSHARCNSDEGRDRRKLKPDEAAAKAIRRRAYKRGWMRDK